MGSPNYIIVLKDGREYATMNRVFQYERPLQANQIKELTEIPEHIADLNDFNPGETVLYLDGGGSKEYVEPGAVKTIINLNTLIEEELSKLDESLEDPEEATY